MTTSPTDDRLLRRAAIEHELSERLAADCAVDAVAPSATAAVARPAATSPKPLDAVALVCAACRGVSSADSRFCTRCGAPFNVMVILRSQ